jgi:AcrR family transcriptional regulator
VATSIERASTTPRRRSRRDDIVAAAVRVFARQGFSDASIQEVAAEAGVAPTAVYYHFSGKEDLFDVALRRILEAVTSVVRATRADDARPEREDLQRVIFAVWDWLEAHGEERQLLHQHLPGVTPQARLLQQQFEEIHLQRAFDYVPPLTTGNRRSAIARHATAALAVRTMINLTLLIHPLRAEDGPLKAQRALDVRQALSDVSSRIVAVA